MTTEAKTKLPPTAASDSWYEMMPSKASLEIVQNSYDKGAVCVPVAAMCPSPVLCLHSILYCSHKIMQRLITVS